MLRLAHLLRASTTRRCAGSTACSRSSRRGRGSGLDRSTTRVYLPWNARPWTVTYEVHTSEWRFLDSALAAIADMGALEVSERSLRMSGRDLLHDIEEPVVVLRKRSVAQLRLARRQQLKQQQQQKENTAALVLTPASAETPLAVAARDDDDDVDAHVSAAQAKRSTVVQGSSVCNDTMTSVASKDAEVKVVARRRRKPRSEVSASGTVTSATTAAPDASRAASAASERVSASSSSSVRIEVADEHDSAHLLHQNDGRVNELRPVKATAPEREAGDGGESVRGSKSSNSSRKGNRSSRGRRGARSQSSDATTTTATTAAATAASKGDVSASDTLHIHHI